jgi:anaerobic ribonucleoside-triphosphate reductase activating protein
VEQVRINGILPCSFVNGDGARYVVFVQGCLHHCDGCHNPETWDFHGGYDYPLEAIANDYKKREKYLDGITLSGGDPFYQQKQCVELLKLVHPKSVWIYTGFEYDDIKHTELASMADVIVTGRYIKELACEGKIYGSSNQKIIRRDKNE